MSYKATPITQKTKSSMLKAHCMSPAKADIALIQGAADIGASKAFVNQADRIKESFGGGKKGSADDAVEVVDTDEPDSVAKLDPGTLMKVAGMIGGGGQKSGGKTTVVINNKDSKKSRPAIQQQPRVSQASNAVDPV